MDSHNESEQPPPTLRAVWNHYLENGPRGHSPNFAEDRRRVWGLFCAFRGAEKGLPYGDRPYHQFRPYHLLQFLDSWLPNASGWTRRHWAGYVTTVMNLAVRLGFISRNPFVGLRLPPGGEGRDWEPSEYQAILRHASPSLRRIVIFIRSELPITALVPASSYLRQARLVVEGISKRNRPAASPPEERGGAA